MARNYIALDQYIFLAFCLSKAYPSNTHTHTHTHIHIHIYVSVIQLGGGLHGYTLPRAAGLRLCTLQRPTPDCITDLYIPWGIARYVRSNDIKRATRREQSQRTEKCERSEAS